MLAHPTVIRPEDHAVFSPGGMGKSTLFASPQLLVGVNAFEPGQAHALHAHAGMDKIYPVLSGEGRFLLDGATSRCAPATSWSPRPTCRTACDNTGAGRLIVLAVLAPGPAGGVGGAAPRQV